MFILVVVADDSDFSLRCPGEELGHVVNDDGDQRHIEVRHPGPAFLVLESTVKIVRG